jgi:CRISPR/Cas system CMR subunit Cmr4 (Cas7 group RAMP superfamily)
MVDIGSAPRPIRRGDKVNRDLATRNLGKVQLGDAAPVFVPRQVRSGDKVERDAATRNPGKVQLGDAAPVFGR